MFNRVLILAPHTDDGEFGCGGTIARFLQEGKEVYYIAFSTSEKSVPKGLPRDILKQEVREATGELGIPPKNLKLYDYAVRDFPACRQEILEDLIVIKKEINPDLVFLPSLNDLHQDHLTIANEGLRAFKNISILGYEIPWNNLTFRTSSFIALQESHLMKKVNALKKYRSQSFRHYANEQFVRSLALTRGTQIGVPLAESFDVIRLFL